MSVAALTLSTLFFTACEEEDKQPNQVTINSIEVRSYGPGPFDTFDGPDLFLNIVGPSGDLWHISSEIYNDATGIGQEFTINKTITNMPGEFTAILIDEDFTSDNDVVGTVTFNGNLLAQDKKPSRTFTNAGISLKFNVSY